MEVTEICQSRLSENDFGVFWPCFFLVVHGGQISVDGSICMGNKVGDSDIIPQKCTYKVTNLDEKSALTSSTYPIDVLHASQ